MKLGIVGVAVLAAAWLILSEPFILPTGLAEGMSVAAPQRCMAIFIVCMSLWLTNMIPLAATGLLVMALLPLLGVLPERHAFGLFGNSAVFFMLGVFLLAGAMISTGLSKRVTLIALHRFDQSPTRLVVGVTVSAAFLTLWMPEHAVAAMMYPIIVEIVDTLGLRRGHNYAKKLFLALAWGSIIGGVGTFLGGARAPLALSLLAESHPETKITFLGWMLAAAPLVIVMTSVAALMLCRRIPNDIDDIKAATRMLDQRVRQLGPMSPRERRLLGLFVVTVFSWIFLSDKIDLALIALLSAVMLFALRVADWKGVQPYVNWGVLIMYGGAVALGSAVDETKAFEWIVGQLIDPTMKPILVVMFMATASMILTEGISNSAAVAIMLPIGYSLGHMTGVGPAMMTMAVTIPAGLAFLLPIGSPPNAICFAAGHYSMRQVITVGWPLNVIGLILVFLLIVAWWGPVLNLNAW